MGGCTKFPQQEFSWTSEQLCWNKKNITLLFAKQQCLRSFFFLSKMYLSLVHSIHTHTHTQTHTHTHKHTHTHIYTRERDRYRECVCVCVCVCVCEIGS